MGSGAVEEGGGDVEYTAGPTSTSSDLPTRTC